MNCPEDGAKKRNVLCISWIVENWIQIFPCRTFRLSYLLHLNWTGNNSSSDFRHIPMDGEIRCARNDQLTSRTKIIDGRNFFLGYCDSCFYLWSNEKNCQIHPMIFAYHLILSWCFASYLIPVSLFPSLPRWSPCSSPCPLHMILSASPNLLLLFLFIT